MHNTAKSDDVIEVSVSQLERLIDHAVAHGRIAAGMLVGQFIAASTPRSLLDKAATRRDPQTWPADDQRSAAGIMADETVARQDAAKPAPPPPPPAPLAGTPPPLFARVVDALFVMIAVHPHTWSGTIAVLARRLRALLTDADSLRLTADREAFAEMLAELIYQKYTVAYGRERGVQIKRDGDYVTVRRCKPSGDGTSEARASQPDLFPRDAKRAKREAAEKAAEARSGRSRTAVSTMIGGFVADLGANARDGDIAAMIELWHGEWGHDPIKSDAARKHVRDMLPGLACWALFDRYKDHGARHFGYLVRALNRALPRVGRDGVPYRILRVDQFAGHEYNGYRLVSEREFDAASEAAQAAAKTQEERDATYQRVLGVSEAEAASHYGR